MFEIQNTGQVFVAGASTMCVKPLIPQPSLDPFKAQGRGWNTQAKTGEKHTGEKGEEHTGEKGEKNTWEKVSNTQGRRGKQHTGERVEKHTGKKAEKQIAPFTIVYLNSPFFCIKTYLISPCLRF